MDINDLCGNHDVYYNILQWLTKMNDKKCAFVVGNACIGKTYSIKKICESLDYDVRQIDTHNCFDSVAFKDMIFKASTSSLVQSIENTDRKKILLIDNFDAFYSADKNIKSSLLKLIGHEKCDRTFTHIPIICITSPEVYKKMGDIQKTCIIFELSNPTPADITVLLKKMNYKPAKIKHIIQNADGNVARVFEILQNNSDMCYSYNDAKHDIMYLYNGNKFDRNIVRNIIIQDPWQIPLRIHENLITELTHCKLKHVQCNRIYADFVGNICLYDWFMSKNDCNIAVDIFCSMMFPIINLRSQNNKKIIMNKFTKLLSYLSLQKKYLKNSYNSDFPFYQIGNYHITLLDRKFICFN